MSLLTDMQVFAVVNYYDITDYYRNRVDAEAEAQRQIDEDMEGESIPEGEKHPYIGVKVITVK